MDGGGGDGGGDGLGFALMDDASLCKMWTQEGGGVRVRVDFI